MHLGSYTSADMPDCVFISDVFVLAELKNTDATSSAL